MSTSTSTSPVAVDERAIDPPPFKGGVVQLLLGTEGGGIITAIQQWAPLLIEAGWPMHFVLLSESKAAEMLRASGLKTEIIKVSRIGRFTRLSRELKRFGPAIIHCHNPSTHVMAGFAGRRLGCRVVRSVHADMFEEMRGSLPAWKIAMWRWAMRWSLSRTDALIVVSPHLIERLPGIRPGAHSVQVLPNGLDPSTIEQDRHPLPDELERQLGDCPMALSMGRLVPVKNYAMLLGAWKDVIEAVPEARLVLAGSGPLRDSLESRRDELGLGRSVMLLPWVDRVAPLLRRSSVVVLSSHSECCPMLVLEAMGAARPVISTSVGGVPKLVEDGVTGRLVRPDDAAALARAIVEVLRSAERSAAMGNAGHARLCSMFTHAHTARRTAAIYGSVVAGGSGVS